MILTDEEMHLTRQIHIVPAMTPWYVLLCYVFPCKYFPSMYYASMYCPFMYQPTMYHTLLWSL